MKPVPRTLWPLWALFSVLLFAPFAAGQGRDEYGEIHQTVARISLLSGEVSFARGDDPDNWQPADRNVPMTLGDRVYTGSRSRLELQLQGGDFIRLGARTDLAALNLTDDTKQLSLKSGIASIQIRRLSDNEIFEVDTPNAAVTFDRSGEYRVDVDANGYTRVSVRRGSATVAAGGGQIPVEAGEAIDIDGIDSPHYDIVSLSRPDDWDRWVSQREDRQTGTRSYQYVSADIVGVDDLDEYGRWENAPNYGWVWSPTTVAADWAPYRSGHWIWQDPWGWTWVSSEAWGWAPYHYGRWALVSSRWCWIPDRPAMRSVSYSPALVAFVGGGPGWSASISVGGGGFIGWFPLGPRDPFNPWWGDRARVGYSSGASNVTYVNKTYVTIVNRNTFVSGGVVTGNIVRDRAVVSQVAAAPVLRGPIPVVPTAGSLHVAVRADAVAAPRPPSAVVSRMVVARTAPPPAPPTFQSKLPMITESRGAPVAPAAAARISVENRGRPQAVSDVRPVAEQPGRVTLSPREAKTGGAAARRAESSRRRQKGRSRPGRRARTGASEFDPLRFQRRQLLLPRRRSGGAWCLRRKTRRRRRTSSVSASGRSNPRPQLSAGGTSRQLRLRRRLHRPRVWSAGRRSQRLLQHRPPRISSAGASVPRLLRKSNRPDWSAAGNVRRLLPSDRLRVWSEGASVPRHLLRRLLLRLRRDGGKVASRLLRRLLKARAESVRRCNADVR